MERQDEEEAAKVVAVTRRRKSGKKGKKKWKRELDDSPVTKLNFQTMIGAPTSATEIDDLLFIDKSGDKKPRRTSLDEKITRADMIITPWRYSERAKHEMKGHKKSRGEGKGGPGSKKARTSKLGKRGHKKIRKNVAMRMAVSEPPRKEIIWTDEEDVPQEEQDGLGNRSLPEKEETLELPSTALSYNPTHEAHQENLKEAYDFLSKKERGKKRLAKRASIVIKRKRAGQKVISNDERAPPVEFRSHPSVRKSLKTKKRDKMARINAKQELENKKKQIISKQLDNLDEIVESVAKEQKEAEERLEKKKVAEMNKKVLPPRFRPPVPTYMLTEDMPDSVINLKQQENPYFDRMKNFQKRGLIENPRRERMPNVKSAHPRRIK